MPVATVSAIAQPISAARVRPIKPFYVLLPDDERDLTLVELEALTNLHPQRACPGRVSHLHGCASRFRGTVELPGRGVRRRQCVEHGRVSPSSQRGRALGELNGFLWISDGR